MKKEFTLDMIEKYSKIQFKEHGRDFDGCDCGGLVHLIYKTELGVELPDWRELYSNTSYSNKLEVEKTLGSMLDENSIEIPLDKIQPFDVLSIRIGNAEMHTGVVIDKNRFIHVVEGNHVTCERINSMHWRNRITGAFRHETML